MSDLTPFDVLMRDNEVVLPGIWQAVFEETEAVLLKACPGGVDLLDVGRAAWDSLFDALFYGWWETYQDRKARDAWNGGAA